jgi:dipeptidyl aminopeptidase/acylaminoacyl peptidase
LQRKLLALDLLTSHSRPSDPQISPEGDRIAFTLAPVSREGEHPAAAIWVVEAGGGEARQFTGGGEWYDAAPRWSPDGARLAFISDRGRRGERTLYAMPAGGGEALRLFERRGKVSEPAWSPDGRYLAFLYTDPETEEEKRRKEERDDARVRDADYKYTRLWVVDAESRAASPVSPEGRQVWGYAWAPDSERLAINTSPAPLANGLFEETEVSVVPRSGGGPEPVFRLVGAARDLVWSPDGRYLAYRARAGRVVNGDYVHRVPAGGGDPECLTPDYRGTGAHLSRLGDSLLLLAHEGLHAAFYRLGWDGRMERMLKGVRGKVVAPVTADREGKRIAAIRQDAAHPPDVYAGGIGGSGLLRRTRLNPELEAAGLGAAEPVRWESDAGVEVEGLLVQPAGYEEGRRYPLVVQAHGGPNWLWQDQFCAGWHDWAQVLASRGYAVLLPNPRGSTGYGPEFTNANFMDVGGGELRDIMSGVDAMVGRGLADPDRLGICGWSWGGYLAAWAITQTERFRAAVVGAGPSNLISDNSLGDIPSANLSFFERTPYDDPDPYYERSPIRYVGNVKTPTLILHGEEDERVSVAESIQLYVALRSLGIETQLVTYPREGHRIEERKHQLDLLRRMAGWFERFLGD